MAEEAVLGFLEKNEEIKDSGEFAVEKGISHEEIVNVIKSLNGFRFVDAQCLIAGKKATLVISYRNMILEMNCLG
ncbi:putative pheRS, DNA binding domain 1 [Helianthus annuus]|nr:putative pheRS, DNA binding domain 1 [Helianthus annuus]